MSVLRAAYLRNKAVEYAYSLLHVPYRWAGDDSLAGFDCNGFIHEILQAIGLEPHGFDSSAHGLYERFKQHEIAAGYAGCLVFWFGPDETGAIIAKHVMLMVDDSLCIGATGGGRKTLTEADAIKQNAFIKQRPIGYRGQDYVVVDPFKELI
jgi:cell wall-associated NlpC family hydrolase